MVACLRQALVRVVACLRQALVESQVGVVTQFVDPEREYLDSLGCPANMSAAEFNQQCRGEIEDTDEAFIFAVPADS